MEITFGSDPEFMLKDANGALKSAIGIVPGTKDERYDLGDGHQCYFDNVLGECSIRPGKSKDDVIASFQQCFSRFAALVAPYGLVIQASADYPAAECQHEEALKFGCHPEYCAYRTEMIQPPECLGTFRSAGGHLHIGYNGGVEILDDEEANFKVDWDRIWVARMCDLFIGIPSLYLDKDPTSKARRKLYGGAGTHRACERYGVEYRALSNFWLKKPSLVNMMYDLASECVRMVTEERTCEDIWSNISPERLQKTINDWDLKKAAKYNAVLEQYLPKQLLQQIENEIKSESNASFYESWGIKV